MQIKTLLAPWVACSIEGSVAHLQNDSRQVQPRDIFFAYKGVETDGRKYMQEAKERGAALIVYDPFDWPRVEGEGYLPLPFLAETLPLIAARFYGYKRKPMTLIGVTGTNGKTTVAYQLAQALQLLATPCSYIGTIGEGEPFGLQTLKNTTPDSILLQKLFSQYAEQQRLHVCMEVSSHALVQERVAAIPFQQAIFTNLTQDHLDYHKTMEEYANAKAKLFAFPSLQRAIVNADSPYASHMQKVVPASCEVYTYGIHHVATVKALSFQAHDKGIELTFTSPQGQACLSLPALGFFHIYNALAIISSLLAQGYPLEQIQTIMPQLLPAPGRLEMVAKEPLVLVDYAHTPDALMNVLKTVKAWAQGKLWVVFGCGGDRDQSKRVLMGDIAGKYADKVIITNDNPRTEDPEQILLAIEKGVQLHTTPVKIVDRKEAIAYALSRAKRKDVIVIAGKGHENYQEIEKVRIPFSDKEVVKNLLS